MQLGIQGIISLKGLLNIPLGNTHAFGSYEGCLAAKSNYMSPCKDSITQEPIETCNPLNLEKEFNGAWLPLTVVSTIDLENLSPPEKNTRIASGISIIGGIGGGIFDQFNLTDIDSVSISLEFLVIFQNPSLLTLLSIKVISH